MTLTTLIDHLFISFMDYYHDRRPQPRPTAQQLRQCKVISHRGEHDGGLVKENTLAAFERAAAAGVWGIELDVRWTRDLVPVVNHDPDLKRVFHHPAAIGDMTWEKLQQVAPDVPALGAVVRRFGRGLHLMIEIKQNQWPDPEHQSSTLKEHLGALLPGEHYHLMALQPETLLRLSGFPGRSLLAIASYRPHQYSRWAMRRNWGGICAHYAMAPAALVRRLHARNCRVGTAYPASRNTLFREINRGVDWIFSNKAAALQRIIDQEIRREQTTRKR